MALAYAAEASTRRECARFRPRGSRGREGAAQTVSRRIPAWPSPLMPTRLLLKSRDWAVLRHTDRGRRRRAPAGSSRDSTVMKLGCRRALDSVDRTGRSGAGPAWRALLGGRMTTRLWTIGERDSPFAGQPWALYLPRDSAYRGQSPRRRSSWPFAAARAEQTLDAEADYTAGREGRDSRRRQRRAADQSHRRAVISGRPAARRGGLHAEWELVLVIRPTNMTCTTCRGKPIWKRSTTTGSIRRRVWTAAALHRGRSDRRRLRHPRRRSVARAGGVSRVRRGPGLHRVLSQRPRRR